jgi:hypothetical protein
MLAYVPSGVAFGLSITSVLAVAAIVVSGCAILFDFNTLRRRVVRHRALRNGLRNEIVAALVVMVLAALNIYLNVTGL